jgi:hypothetical protein
VDDSAMLLYYRLISIVDDYGRYDWDPDIIRGRCFFFVLDRWPTERVSQCLDQLLRPTNSSPLIRRYEVDGRKYLELLKFGQRTQAKPKFPPPVVANGSHPSEKPKAAGKESPRFSEWWEMWSKVRGTARKSAASTAWCATVTPQNDQACIDCTRSYLDSLESPNKGFNPDTFLLEQAKEHFEARWPARATKTKMTPTEEAIAEAKEKQKK